MRFVTFLKMTLEVKHFAVGAVSFVKYDVRTFRLPPPPYAVVKLNITNLPQNSAKVWV